jgi:hypothetical protein
MRVVIKFKHEKILRTSWALLRNPLISPLTILKDGTKISLLSMLLALIISSPSSSSTISQVSKRLSSEASKIVVSPEITGDSRAAK